MDSYSLNMYKVSFYEGINKSPIFTLEFYWFAAIISNLHFINTHKCYMQNEIAFKK